MLLHSSLPVAAREGLFVRNKGVWCLNLARQDRRIAYPLGWKIRRTCRIQSINALVARTRHPTYPSTQCEAVRMYLLLMRVPPQ